MIDPLLQRPLKMGNALRRTPKPQTLTYIIPSLFTQFTFLTRKSDFKSNSVSNFQVCDTWANSCHDAGGLVTKSEGFLDDDIAVAVVVEVMEVGAAETCGLDCDLDF